MRVFIAIVAAALAAAHPTLAENRFEVVGVAFGPVLFTPLTAVAIEIPDARLAAIVNEPLKAGLESAGIAYSGGRHRLKIWSETRDGDSVTQGSAVLVSLSVVEPIRVWHGGYDVSEYPEYVVWQQHELLLLPLLSSPHTAEARDGAVAAAAERLVAAFLKAVRGLTPPKPAAKIPHDCPDSSSAPGA